MNIGAFFILSMVLIGDGALAGTTPPNTRVANYDMRARLAPSSKTVEGSYRLTWTNTSSNNVGELRFHLYLNAFKNAVSTFMKENGGRRGDELSFTPQDRGAVDILSLETADGRDLTSRMEFIAPDDGNASDSTVIRVPLDRPVMPGQTIEIVCRFLSKLPRLAERTGFTDDDFFMVAQWFPKIGVWQDTAWNCHQFHGLSEFFADFGTYDMVLTTPKDFVVAANASLVKKTDLDSLTEWTFRQEDVIDAVWAASPFFIVDNQKVVIEPSGKTIDIQYVFSPGREVMKERYADAVSKVFNYYDRWVGPYAYSHMTILDVPMGEESSAGGMEYPCLVTTGSFYVSKTVTDLVGVHVLEIVTFHEIGHNYFQSVVASNEFEEPWLDEGFTTYLEHRSMQHFFHEKNLGEYVDVAGLRVQSLDYHRQSYVARPRDGMIVGKAWDIAPGYYQTAAYSKPTLLLSTLERLVGDSAMIGILRTYYERWKFRHPSTADFVALVREKSPKDLSWFFEQYLFSNKTVDLQVARIRSERRESADSMKAYDGVVRLRNKGDGFFPVEVVVHFENGDTTAWIWDGRDAFREWRFEAASRLKSVQIDPRRINLLDLNLGNNSMTAEPEPAGIWRYTVRLLFWLQSVLSIFSMVA